MYGSFAGGSLALMVKTSGGKQSWELSSRLPTEAIALKAARALRIDANAQTPQAESGPETIAELVAHYRLKELNEDSHSQKAFPTRAAYRSYLDNWVLPRWGELKLDQIKPVAVEEWLDGIKRAKATRAKIRNLMSALFSHAMRYEWSDKNPIKLVRQSAKRERIPDVLELSRTSASSHQARYTRTHTGSAGRCHGTSCERAVRIFGGRMWISRTLS